MRAQLDAAEKKFYSKTEEGRAYLEYNNKISGESIELIVPNGYPDGVEERGGVVAVYEECIKKGVTWEKLLGYKPLPDDVII